MVLLLNYLPWIIAAIGIFLVFKVKGNRSVAFVVVGTIAALILLQGLTAGYIPKMRSSEVKIPATAFEPVEGEMQDRLRSPQLLGKDSASRASELTDWRQHKRDEAAKAAVVTPTTVPVIEYKAADEVDKAEKPAVKQ